MLNLFWLGIYGLFNGVQLPAVYSAELFQVVDQILLLKGWVNYGSQLSVQIAHLGAI